MLPNEWRTWPSAASSTTNRIDTSTPTMPIGLTSRLRSGARNSSTMRIASAVPSSASSGASANQSKVMTRVSMRVLRRLEDREDGVHVLRREPEDQEGQEAQEEDQHQQRRPAPPLDRRHVRQAVLLPGIRRVAHVHPLQHPQEV